MSEIDPVEFGEMKSNITHTMTTVGEIKSMLQASVEKFDTAKVEADRANVRLDTIAVLDEQKCKDETKSRRKLGMIYSAIAAIFGFIASFIKG